MQNIELKGKTILITGGAGFIGSNLILKLLRTVENISIVSIDNLNDYYDVSIKEWRLSEIEKEVEKHPNSKYYFIKGDIADKNTIDNIFNEYKLEIVVNLAAQAGVRYSIINPDEYIKSKEIKMENNHADTCCKKWRDNLFDRSAI